MNDTCKRRNGFALMELLIVLAITGIFGSIVFSFGKRALDRAYLFADETRLSYLVTQYMSAVDNGLDLANVKNTVDFAVALARADGPNEISAYQSQKRRNKQHKEILINGEKNPDLREEDFDFIFVNPKCKGNAGTPLFYTRGLQSDGTWNQDSVYGSQGGLIAFEDSVRWMSKVSQELLRVMRYRNGGHSLLFLPVSYKKIEKPVEIKRQNLSWLSEMPSSPLTIK